MMNLAFEMDQSAFLE
ncbi:hypothetical protein F383_26864 [Gossypium arboreum]|uniref:Uncharacterized protein n=1 Tax=Gossypium arboreum TaxID=29729 RepID=A0A0B0MLV0_GOSAR|nr:hypothetical protein F383_26864 [Gossypium arboreum]